MARVILHADKRIFGFLCREKKIKYNNNLFKYSYWNSSQRKNQPTPTSSDCNLGNNEQRNRKSKLENIKMDVEQTKERNEAKLIIWNKVYSPPYLLSLLAHISRIQMSNRSPNHIP